MKKTSFTSNLLRALGKSSVIFMLSAMLVGTVTALSVNWEETILYATVNEAVAKLTSEAPPKVEVKTAKSQDVAPLATEENFALADAYISNVCACDDGSGNVTFNVTISNWPTTGGPYDVGLQYTRDGGGVQVASDGPGGTPADPSGEATVQFIPVVDASSPTGTVSLISIIEQGTNFAVTIDPSPVAYTISDPLMLTCPANQTEVACQDQSAIDAAFATWLAGASTTDGCDPDPITNNNTGAPDHCGGTTTVTFTATDGCGASLTCDATFTVADAPAVVLTCPADQTEVACQSSTAIDAAFAAWLGSVSSSGGCNAVLSTSPATPTRPDECGGVTTVTWTVASDCEADVTCTAVFTVEEPDLFSLTCPTDSTIAAGQTQAAADAAFSAWLTTATSSGGCPPVALTNNAPAGAPDVCTGGSVTVTFTATPTGSCDPPLTCDAIFTVPPTDLDSDPTAPATAACNGTVMTLVGNPSGGTSPYTHSWLALPAGVVTFNDASLENPEATITAGPSAVTVTITYDVTDAAGCTVSKNIEIYVPGINECNPEFNITDPCVCNDDADVNFDNGTFMELISIVGPGNAALPAGMTWTLSYVNGAFTASPLNEESIPGPQGAVIAAGQLLQYCDPVLNPAGCTVYNSPGGTILTALPGSYYLVFAHVDHEGYTVQAQGPNPDTDGDPASIEPGNITLDIDNVCYYPQPAFLNLPSEVCQNAAIFTISTNLAGSGTGTFMGDATFFGGNPPYTYGALPAGFLTDNGNGTATIDPSQAVPGCYTISYTFVDDLFLGPHDPGCYQAIEATIIVTPADDPTFTVNAPVCQGDAPRILALDNPLATWPSCSTPAPTDGDRVRWYGGDGVNITVVDNGNGTGTLTVSATAASGVYTVCAEAGVDPCKSNYCVDVLVNPSYTAGDVQLIADQTICLTPNQLFSFSALLDANAKLGGTFTATAVPAALGTILPNGFVYAQGDGTLAVTYTLTNCDGSSVSDQVILTIDEAPSGTFSLPAVVCQDAGVKFPVFNAKPNFTYAWSQSPLAPPAFVDPVTGAFDPATVGLGTSESATVQVTMTVSNGVCADHTQTQNVVVNASGNPAFVLQPTICESAAPLALSLANPNNDGGTPLNADNVTWTGTGVTDNGVSGTFDPTGLAPGIYTVCVTVGAPSCEETECHDIVVTKDYLAADVALVPDFGLCLVPDNIIDFYSLLNAGALAGGNFSVTGTTGTITGTYAPGSTGFQYTGGCGTITIRYQFNNDCAPAGAPTFDEVTVTVEQKATNLSIMDVGPVCVTDLDQPVILNQNFLSLPICGDYGDFFGAGVTDFGTGAAVFSPGLAGEGTHQITYQIGGNLVSSCQTTLVSFVTVKAASDPTFELPAVVCIADIPAGGLPLNLTNPHPSVQAGSAGNTNGVSEVVWFGGLGADVTDNLLDETGVFNPSQPGTYTICVRTGDISCEQVFCRDIIVEGDAVIVVNPLGACDDNITLSCGAEVLGNSQTVLLSSLQIGIPTPISFTLFTRYNLGTFDLEGLLCAGSTQGGTWSLVSSPTPTPGFTVGPQTGAVQGNTLYFTEPGCYEVNYTVERTGSCTATQNYRITIGEKPTPSLDLPSAYCYDGGDGDPAYTFNVSDYVTSPAYAYGTPTRAYTTSNASVIDVDPVSGVATVTGWGNVTICLTETFNYGLGGLCPGIDGGICQVQVCQSVTVEDNTPPTALCKSIVVDLDPTGHASIVPADVDNGSQDNCDATLSMTLSNSDFDCDDLGYTAVILTVEDDNNNTHQCAAQVLVRDVTAPEMDCTRPEPDTVNLTLFGAHIFSLADFPGLVATDACNEITYSFVPPIAYCEDAETTVSVVVTATDGSGNSTSCTIPTYVDDVTAPPIIGVCHDLTIELDELGQAPPLVPDDIGAVVQDECGQAILVQVFSNTMNVDSIDCTAIGVHQVQLAFRDQNGNYNYCNAIVTVVDKRPPLLECVASVDVILDPVTGCTTIDTSGMFVAGPYDNCGLERIDFQDMAGNLSQTVTYCCDDVGLNTVTIKAKDNHDNSSYCTVVVNVIDDTAPVLHCDPLVRVFAADSGVCSVKAANKAMDIVVDTDNCPPVDIRHNYPSAPHTFTLDDAIFPVGSTIVTWTATDASGNTSECSIEIIVNDTQVPTVTFCPADTSVIADATTCGAVFSYAAPTFNDNCDGSGLLGTLVSGYASGTQFPLGTTTVRWEYTDAAGNGPAVCEFDVTVIDSVAPVALCQPAYTVALDGDGLFEILVTDIDNGSWDNCGLIVRREIDRGAGFEGSVFVDCDDVSTVAGSGTVIITLEVEDQFGNTAQCQTFVTVFDVQVPDIECPSNLYVSNDPGLCAAVVAYNAPSVTDNCLSPVVQTGGLPSGSTFPVGVTVNTFSTTDVGGNIETCSFLVVVLDTEKPVLDCGSLVRVRANDADLCSYTAVGSEFDVTATDNCGYTLRHDYAGASSITTLAGTTFPVGITQVIWTAQDAAGNHESCTIEIVVEDKQLPIVTFCPSDITVGTDAATCGAVVTYALPKFQDNCDGINLTGQLVSGYASGTLFPLGTTTVTWEYTDLAGNGTGFCVFTVTVEDDVTPTAICQDPFSVTLAGDGLYEVLASQVDLNSFDNCGVVSTEISRDGVDFAGSFFVECSDIGILGFGLVPVTLQVADAAGNTATCETFVLVYDVQVPDIECPGNYTVVADATGGCSAVVNYPLPLVIDNCDYTLIQVDTSGLTTGDEFPVGQTTQTWVAIDNAGNIDECSFVIIVVDEISPAIDCGALVRTVSADNGECSYTAIADQFDPTATDNCPGVILTHNFANAADPNTLAGSTFPVGTTLVTWVATDAFGNNSPICGIEIVVTDDEDPTITCGSNITVNNDPGLCSFQVTSTGNDPTFSDNCEGAVLTHNFATAPSANSIDGATFPVGTTTLVWTVTDASGNTATCSFDVTVTDNEAPVFTNCPVTMVMVGNDVDKCSGKLNWSIPVATDNCALLPAPNGIVQTGGPQNGTEVPVGVPYTVTYTATDIHGNSSTCVFQVQVADTQKPSFDADIVMPTNITVECNAIPDNCVFHGNGVCSPLTNDDVHDNCTSPGNLVINFSETSTQDPNANNCGHYNYTLTRTWTVTDEAGNVLTHVQVITVQDTQAPVPTCQNTTITLDKFGVATIDPKALAVGTTDNCAPFSALTVTASKTSFGCADLGENNVTLTITDPCGNSTTCTIVVTVVEGIGSCTPQGTMASTCLNNATTLTNGQFKELITIKALAGQTWTVVSSSGLYTATSPNPPAAPTPVANGTALVLGSADGIDNNGNGQVDEADEMVFYTFNARYIEAIGYTATLTNNLGQTVTLSNVGHYPTPALKNWYPPFCLNTPAFVPEVTDLYAGDGQYVSVTFLLDGNPITVLDPSTLGPGQHSLVITVDAGDAAFSRKVNGVLVAGDAATSDEARLNPGCVQSTTEFFHVVTTPSQVTCNDLVHVTLDTNCTSVVLPDMVLEGTYPCFDDYEVHIKMPNGVPLNPSNVVTSVHVGLTLEYNLWHPLSGNACWGHIKVEDKTKPTVTCPADLTILCTVDADSLIGNFLFTGEPGVFDCSSWNREYTDDYTVFEECADNPEDAVHIVRTFVVTDAWGNQSTCSQTIIKKRGEAADVVFPADWEISCNDPALPGLVASNFSPAQTGWPKISGQNITTTGTGICGLGVSYTDEIVNMCVESYKVVRTWKIFDWCPAGGGAPSQTTFVQYILIKNVAPTITLDCQDIDPVTGFCILNATEPGNPPHTLCYALLVPFAQVDGVCDNIKKVTVETPAGFTTNGGLMPAPGLPIGGPYDLIYRAEDQCGNITQFTLTVVVKDKVAPVAVCDKITDVTLSSDGVATVFATTFDDGSHDNCCLDHFLVRKMVDNCDDGHDDTVFGPSVEFCCDDITNSPVTVVFRAVDCEGNYNDCMVDVNVFDKLSPLLVYCPPAQRADCDWYADNVETQLAALAGDQDAQSQLLDQYFGAPTFTDNCDLTIKRTFNNNVDQCLDGPITRVWYATDPSNNKSQNCTQTIFIDHVSDWAIEFPADATVECGTTPPDFGEPKIFNETCELIAVSYQDEVFNVDPLACYKIVRTWTVINWCVVGAEVDQEVIELSEAQLWNQGVTTLADRDINGDGFFNAAETNSNKSHRTFRDSWNNMPGKKHKPVRADNQSNGPITDPDTDPDSDPWDGFITYQQVIKVFDTVNPVFTNGCTIPDVCILDNTCTATVTLPTPEIEECSPTVNFVVTSDLGTGFGPFTNVAPGTYAVKYVAKDKCNNQAECTTTITVKDCKKPTPYCKNGLVIGIDPPDPHITIWASDFDAGSFDNCTAAGNLTLSFSANVADVSRTYYCEDLGQQAVQIWVTDEAGNQDYCETFIEIQDNFNVCEGTGGPLVAGKIQTEQTESVAGVEVQLSGAAQMSMTTTNSGVFSFSVVPGGDYTVTPVKDDDPLNGVSTFDLVLITKHILGVTPLNSPYKVIAADANKSGTVTTFDLVQLRKLILFIDTEFPNNTSWRFVDKDYVFPNPANPWAEVFPEIISMNNVSASQLATDFVAIKIGDVNGSAQANLLGGVEDRNTTGSLVFAIDDTRLTAGMDYTVDFKAQDFDVLGYQFTLNFDRSALDFVQVNPSVAGTENFGLTLLEEGAITTSWNDNDTRLSDGEVVFSLVFRAKSDVKLSDVLSVNSRFTKAEAYQRNGELLDVELAFGGATVKSGFELYQNTPNPFNASTVIGFNLPEAVNATLTISDVSGRIVKVVNSDFAKGYNEIRLERRELPTTGILYYQLDTPTDSATKMMLLIE